MTLPDLTRTMELTGPGRRVLIVEDYVPWLLRLTTYWEAAGHEVTAMIGVLEISDFVAVGPGANPDEIVTVDLRTVQAAFLDHYFAGRAYNGATLTRELMLAAHPRIFGMSTDSVANAAMRQSGAIGALRKSELMRLFP